jgi:hypothetical protein
MRRELGRIDENRHHHALGMFRCKLDQRDMAGMQGAHCGHERDTLALRAEAGERLFEIGAGVNDKRKHDGWIARRAGSAKARNGRKPVR